MKLTCTCSAQWVARRGGKRYWNNTFAEGVEEACHYWYDNFLPLHMTMEAYSRYDNPASTPEYIDEFIGYMPRAAKYEEYKYNKFGHTLPLVFDGEARESTRQSPAFRSSVKQKGGIEAEVTFGIGNADRGIPVNKPGIKSTSTRITSNQIREEFTTVNYNEVEEMAEATEKKLTKLLDERLV